MTHIRASLSQRAFAEQLGVPLRTYQTYEQNQREPDLRTLTSLYLLGWSLNWVLLGEGEEHLSPLQSNDSQLMRSQEFTLAIQLAEEALDGGKLEPGDYAQLVTLIYDALVNGLPSAQVLAFARPAARGFSGSGKGQAGDAKASVGRAS